MVCCYINHQLGCTTLSILFYSLMTSMKDLGEERGAGEAEFRTFCDSMGRCGISLFSSSHRWFTAHPRMVSLFLPPYSPFLKPIEGLFSSQRWKVYDQQPYNQMSLLDTMNARCLDTSAGMDQATLRFFPGVLAERTEGVMWMRTWGQMQKTDLTSTVECLYL